jgi:hypothetical protein
VGSDQAEKAMVRSHYAANALKWRLLVAYVPLRKIRKEKQTMRSDFGALVLIVAGIIFLLSNLGMIPHVWPLLRQWWPLGLIIAGVIILIEHKGK